ncbi:Rieske (2Fe-2S) protein [Pseudobacteriovorax antillogorgiicola]|uniref:Ferredoxin subunit of nitrite reductase or a ring-hydroxylating dioxygenase n=1 Tax=Pseudobacteriovorax antillogorgiicola TaxID=1513793 RepID=A0A1Y6BM48_9BACT|nr:Rieske (2Fe-2S) protein [Pseudobacteriovorax antillogorgiicola]TCS54501.1 nitrite reductase/ring-hydroxylating ferredoxin subunit [Pseudobacteriovorax antillogorgiicola]SMF19031.1 Ferredoxin subunit of nitrite reductase or a ring-hydroxylating dioxygenase [Pseudobacteriovorax antillogorgiicola]
MLKHLQVARYHRRIPVSLVRIFENVYDWEHLPHLHSSTFAELRLIEVGRQYFKAQSVIEPKILGLSQKFSLYGSRKRRLWQVKILDGIQKGMIVHTKVKPLQERLIEVDVQFFVPLRKLHLIPLAWLTKITYKRLYEEDAAMMVERQEQLDRLKRSQECDLASPLDLGDESVIRQNQPFKFSRGKFSFWLLQHQGVWRAFSSTCPHMLAELDTSHINGDHVECPWHGYRFRIDDGTCQNDRWRLACPRIEESGGRLFACFQ